MKNPSDREVIESPPPRASGFKVPGLRWWMMLLIMLGSILNYLTRNTLSVAQVQVKDSLNITEQQYGMDYRSVSNGNHVSAHLRLCFGRGRT